jgi:hypothetical protein
MCALMIAALIAVGRSDVAAQRGAGGQRGAGPAPAPQTARTRGPVDFTGTWVSVVTEDWRWRMVTPPKDASAAASIPANQEARSVAQAWDLEADNKGGNLYFNGIELINNSQATVVYSTVIRNNADPGHSAIQCTGVNNSITVRNSAVIDIGLGLDPCVVAEGGAVGAAQAAGEGAWVDGQARAEGRAEARERALLEGAEDLLLVARARLRPVRAAFEVRHR